MGLNILVKYFSHFDPNGMLNKKLLETNLKRPSIIIILHSCIRRYCGHRSMCIAKHYLLTFDYLVSVTSLDGKFFRGTQCLAAHLPITLYLQKVVANDG